MHQLLRLSLISQGFADFSHQVVRVYDGFNDYEFSKPYLKNGVVWDPMLSQVSLGERYNLEAKFKRVQVWLEFMVLVVEPRKKAQKAGFKLVIFHDLEDDLCKQPCINLKFVTFYELKAGGLHQLLEVGVLKANVGLGYGVY